MDMHLRKVLASVVGRLSAPIFLAGYEEKTFTLTLHVRTALATEVLKREAERAVVQAGLLLNVRVRGHRLSTLTHPHSLEHWLRRFGTGEVVYDPTHIALRARGLVAAATSCRTGIGSAIVASFFDPSRRSLVVFARLAKDATEALAMRLRIAAIARKAWQQAMDATGHAHALAQSAAPQLNVHVVANAPVGSFVPVDSRSASFLSKVRGSARRWAGATVLAVSMAFGATAAHAKLTTPSAGTSSVQTEWGVLPGLSVFAEGSASSETEPFALEGLRFYLAQAGFGCQDDRGRSIACPPVYLGS